LCYYVFTNPDLALVSKFQGLGLSKAKDLAFSTKPRTKVVLVIKFVEFVHIEGD